MSNMPSEQKDLLKSNNRLELLRGLLDFVNTHDSAKSETLWETLEFNDNAMVRLIAGEVLSAHLVANGSSVKKSDFTDFVERELARLIAKEEGLHQAKQKMLLRATGAEFPLT